jgi:hypothetical protein
MRTHPDEEIRFSVLGYAFAGRGLIRNGHGICTYAPKAANREGDCSFSTKSANLNSPASREAGPGGKLAGCLMSYATEQGTLDVLILKAVAPLCETLVLPGHDCARIF